MSPDKIKLVLRVEGLNQLAEEMAVGGYFSERHDASEEELPEMEQRVLDDGGIELTMPLKLKSIGGYRNVIVPEGNGMTLKQDAVIRAIYNARKWTDMVNPAPQYLLPLLLTSGLALTLSRQHFYCLFPQLYF